LLKLGLVDVELVEIGQGRAKLFTLTSEGKDVVRNAGGVVVVLGRAGFAHEFWRARLRALCERAGYTVGEEGHLGSGKRVDLLATRAQQRLLLEIETGAADVSGNVAKCAGQDAMLVLFCTTMSLRDHLRSRVAAKVHVFAPDTIAELRSLLA